MKNRKQYTFTLNEELIKWSIDERTEVFLKIQEGLSLGEGKASK